MLMITLLVIDNDAILLAENPSTKSRYETARNSIRSLGSNRLGFSNVLQTYEPQARSRCQKLHDQGKLDFTSHPTNSAQNYVLAHDLVLKGYKDLANSVLPEAGGSFIDANDIIGSLSGRVLLSDSNEINLSLTNDFRSRHFILARWYFTRSSSILLFDRSTDTFCSQ